MSVSTESPGEVGCYTLELQGIQASSVSCRKGRKILTQMTLPHHRMGWGWG